MKRNVPDPSQNDSWMELDNASMIAKYLDFFTVCARQTTRLNPATLKQQVTALYAEGPASIDLMDLWGKKMANAFNEIGSHVKRGSGLTSLCKSQRAVAAVMKEHHAMEEQVAPAAEAHDMASESSPDDAQALTQTAPSQSSRDVIMVDESPRRAAAMQASSQLLEQLRDAQARHERIWGRKPTVATAAESPCQSAAMSIVISPEQPHHASAALDELAVTCNHMHASTMTYEHAHDMRRLLR